MELNRTEKRKRHRRRYIAKHIAKFQALQIQHDHNTTSSIATVKAPRGIQTTVYPIAGSLVAQLRTFVLTQYDLPWTGYIQIRQIQ